jgi:hypothetical protein
MKPPLLPAGAPLAEYERQVQSLLDEAVSDQAAATPLTRDGAHLAVARSYGFPDWASLSDFVADFGRGAVVGGDLDWLHAALPAPPGLVHDRSTNCKLTGFVRSAFIGVHLRPVKVFECSSCITHCIESAADERR